MEVTFNEFFDGHPRVGQVVSQVHVAQLDQACGPRVNETGREHTAFLVVFALREKAARGLETRLGQLVEAGGL